MVPRGGCHKVPLVHRLHPDRYVYCLLLLCKKFSRGGFTRGDFSFAAEPVLSATRKVVKPFNGLDVSPIVWFAILSFLSEILTGPQGILSLLQRKGL